jgi:hypothetical protein
MRDFFTWAAAEPIRERPWCILGKGPSFAKHKTYDLSGYYRMSLNHAVRETPVHVAHIIDFDVVEDLGAQLSLNAQYVVLPWTPHVKCKPGKKTLEQLLEDSYVLKHLDSLDRLLWYNLGSGTFVRAGSPAVPVRYFSVEAALNLLAMAGVKTIKTLGIDGGADYSQQFTDLKEKTLLQNGWNSFDKQFQGMAKTIATYELDCSPLDVQSPIKVFIGCTESEELPAKVLEFSIKQRSSISVEVTRLADYHTPLPLNTTHWPRTPFSFQRFLIPSLCGYQGRAIYLDADMLCFQDFRTLWLSDMNGYDVLAAAKQSSVMLMNCRELKMSVDEIVSYLDKGLMTYGELMDLKWQHAGRLLPDEWNSLEFYKYNRTAILHYTNMHRQPWVSRGNPLGYLWVRELLEAIRLADITESFVAECVAKKYVRPSLLYQVQNGIEDAVWLPRRARQLDSNFHAPYTQQLEHGSRNKLRQLARSWVRSYWHNSPLEVFSHKVWEHVCR